MPHRRFLLDSLAYPLSSNIRDVARMDYGRYGRINSSPKLTTMQLPCHLFRRNLHYRSNRLLRYCHHRLRRNERFKGSALRIPMRTFEALPANEINEVVNNSPWSLYLRGRSRNW
jgi:hypothetical protein